eukprot:761583-Hanusia_phi.AAC.1
MAEAQAEKEQLDCAQQIEVSSFLVRLTPVTGSLQSLRSQHAKEKTKLEVLRPSPCSTSSRWSQTKIANVARENTCLKEVRPTMTSRSLTSHGQWTEGLLAELKMAHVAVDVCSPFLTRAQKQMEELQTAAQAPKLSGGRRDSGKLSDPDKQR